MTAPAGTGAREVVQAYYEALLRQEWAAAHGELDEDSRRRVGPEAFAALARTWRTSLGFEPQTVHVRSCEEQADGATAHVVLLGHDEARQRYKDAVTLRRGPAGWGVVLPPSFGRPRTPPGR
jgi:hypothetical protein